MAGREIGHTRQRIEVASVHLSGVGDDDRRLAAPRGERRLEGRDVQPPDRVARATAQRLPADPEQRQGLARAGVHVAAAQDLDRLERLTEDARRVASEEGPEDPESFREAVRESEEALRSARRIRSRLLGAYRATQKGVAGSPVPNPPGGPS